MNHSNVSKLNFNLKMNPYLRKFKFSKNLCNLIAFFWLSLFLIVNRLTLFPRSIFQNNLLNSSVEPSINRISSGLLTKLSPSSIHNLSSSCKISLCSVPWLLIIWILGLSCSNFYHGIWQKNSEPHCLKITKNVSFNLAF